MRKILLVLFAICACDKYEYATVQKVLACSGKECRVLLNDGRRATVNGITVEGDHVYTEQRWRMWLVIK